MSVFEYKFKLIDTCQNSCGIDLKAKFQQDGGDATITIYDAKGNQIHEIALDYYAGNLRALIWIGGRVQDNEPTHAIELDQTQ